MRSKQLGRSGRLARGISTSLLSRGVLVLGPLITIPIALEHLGASAYGAWSAALALTALATFADLGLGVGLMTRLARTLSDNDIEHSRILVSSAYGVLGAAVGTLLAVVWVSSVWVDFGELVGAKPGVNETSYLVLVTLSGFFVNAVASLIVRVQYAAQEVARSNLWQTIGSLTTVVVTFAGAWLDLRPWLFVLCVAGAVPAVLIVNTVAFFTIGSGRHFRPRIRCVRVKTSRELLGLGSRFLLISILMSVALSTDNLIVAHTTSLDEVPEYAIPARAFALLGVVVSSLTIPLWPANVEALNAGEVGWVRRVTTQMTMLSTISVVLLGGAAVVVAPTALNWWLGGAIEPQTSLLVGFALMATLQALSAPMFMVQNAAEVLRPQTIGYSLLLLVLPVKWYASANWGFDVLPWINAVGYFVVILPAAIVGYRRSLQSKEAIFG